MTITGTVATLPAFAILLGATAGIGCGAPAPAASAQPPGWDDEIRLREAEDEDPDPGVVEVRLTAKPASIEILPGKKTEVWTYDGAVPGPLIHAKKGDHLIVHFENQLPVETTVHWHGVRAPNAMDGVPDISGPVPPGGTFDYAFDLEHVAAKVGDTQVWTVTNEMEWAHPFHLHGFFFQVLEADLAPSSPLAWKDTVSIPQKQTRRFAVRYEDRPGMWMFHCHILDHADMGLMGIIMLGE